MLAEEFQLILRHHRFVTKLAFLDFVQRYHFDGIHFLQGDRFGVLRFHDAGHDPAIAIENRRLVLFGHDGTWVYDIT